LDEDAQTVFTHRPFSCNGRTASCCVPDARELRNDGESYRKLHSQVRCSLFSELQPSGNSVWGTVVQSNNWVRSIRNVHTFQSRRDNSTGPLSERSASFRDEWHQRSKRSPCSCEDPEIERDFHVLVPVFSYLGLPWSCKKKPRNTPSSYVTKRELATPTSTLLANP
jgi:hypothetical protein